MAIEIKNELRAAAIVAGGAGGVALQLFGMSFERTGIGVYVFTMEAAVDPTQLSIYCAPGINELSLPRGRFLSPTVLEVRSYTGAGAPIDCVVLFVEVHRYPGRLGAIFPAAPPVPTPSGAGGSALVSFGNNTIGTTADTRFLDPWWDDSTGTTTRIQYVVPRPGTFSNLAVLHNTPNGNGNPIVYSLERNGAPTALSVSMPSTDSVGTDDVNMIAVLKGDLISMSAVKALSIGSSPSDIMATLNFAG